MGIMDDFNNGMISNGDIFIIEISLKIIIQNFQMKY